jgi:hypothetical protein
MFSKFINRSSSCSPALYVDAINGSAVVQFNNGSIYRYSNVSRRAIINLMMNDNMSTGFWINQNLVGAARTKSVRSELGLSLV